MMEASIILSGVDITPEVAELAARVQISTPLFRKLLGWDWERLTDAEIASWVKENVPEEDVMKLPLPVRQAVYRNYGEYLRNHKDDIRARWLKLETYTPEEQKGILEDVRLLRGLGEEALV